MRALRPGFYAPTVWTTATGYTRPATLRQVSASLERPARAIWCEIEDSHLLALSASRGLLGVRGEWPPPAYILSNALPSVRDREDSVSIKGRSAALAMALASLAAVENITGGDRVVLATGNLTVEADGRVLPVDGLTEKLDLIGPFADPDERALVLLPKCQEPSAQVEPNSGYEPLSVTAWGSFTSRFPGAAARTVWVDHLAEAANVVFDARAGEPFDRSEVGRLRAEIERLRYDEGQLARIFEACRELEEAVVDQGDSLLRTITRHHVRIVAIFVAAKRRAQTLRWAGREYRGDELIGVLRDELQAIREHSGHRLPPEAVAEGANFDAIRAFFTADFGWAVALCTSALALPGLVGGGYSEYRKLLGTRAQFGWRLAMRLLAAGLGYDAMTVAKRAHKDISEALAMAESSEGGVERRNDLGRVCVYYATATEALRVLEKASGLDAVPPDAAERAATVLSRTLGPFGPVASTEGAWQDPIWGLVPLYRRWLNDGAFNEIVAHFVRTAALPHPDAQVDDAFAAASLARGYLPADTYVGALLMEAALSSSHPRRRDAAELAAKLAARTDSWHTFSLVYWLPVLDAPAEWATVNAVRDVVQAWVDEAGSAPLPAAADAFLESRLQALRAAVRAGDAVRARAERVAVLRWFGEPVAS